MNKAWYSFGNPFKVKFREHYCLKCGIKLLIVKHQKVVSQKSEEAKYYDFGIGVDSGVMIGSCEFIHKVFHCPKCLENMEFVTQLNLEDINILIKKVERYYNKKGKTISIKKYFETQNGSIKKKIDKIENISNLCLFIDERGKEPVVYKIPITRKNNWERPYYFKVSKKQLLNVIRDYQ